jgi:hypothetical protein
MPFGHFADPTPLAIAAPTTTRTSTTTKPANRIDRAPNTPRMIPPQ